MYRIQLSSRTKPNYVKYHIFGNKKRKVPPSVNKSLGVFIFSFAAIIFKVCYISCVTHFSSAQLLAIFFFLLSKWSFVSLLWDETYFHCSSSQAVQTLPTVLACSTSHYWCIISCMPYSLINCFWSNVNRLENWDIYEV